MTESWEAPVAACRRARLYHAAFTVVGKEVELEAITQLKKAGMGVREIARLTKIPRSTVSRLCRDLPGAKRQMAMERAEISPELLAAVRAAVNGSELELRLSDGIESQRGGRESHGRIS
ncbi:helix-turn-helix domain-containing protein [Brevibacterium gallinarum]|uniref:Helix-turn-helix domain-containing protein n=1 Tax=Brevibacterium gallinarum TaxID=2762220 RepID=A0ABR8WWX6_9MICO|nr:helix-turn-helix domain-containing protein [Brevibacterium gallinarum]